MSQTQFPAQAVVEKNIRAALIPASILNNWIKDYDIWRKYIIIGIITMVQPVIFMA